MIGYKKLLITAAIGIGLMAIPGYAQYSPQSQNDNRTWSGDRDDRDRAYDHDRDRDWDRDNDRGRVNNPANYTHDSERSAYQQGYRDAQWDNEHGAQQRNRYWQNDYDARAY